MTDELPKVQAIMYVFEDDIDLSECIPYFLKQMEGHESKRRYCKVHYSHELVGNETCKDFIERTRAFRWKGAKGPWDDIGHQNVGESNG